MKSKHVLIFENKLKTKTFQLGGCRKTNVNGTESSSIRETINLIKQMGIFIEQLGTHSKKTGEIRGVSSLPSTSFSA